MVHAEPPSPLPSRLPWDFHPALTEDRLRICARLLAHARRDALAMASYEPGDYPWLEVLDDSAHFDFVIGSNGHGVPVRFYRGAADEPTERTLRRQEME